MLALFEAISALDVRLIPDDVLELVRHNLAAGGFSIEPGDWENCSPEGKLDLLRTALAKFERFGDPLH
ncbi:hypothetical protein [Alsobacter soli]|nr:hypothetical protein [Alsobacter soli]